MITSKPRKMKKKSKNYKKGEFGYGDGDRIEICCDICGKHFILKYRDRQKNYRNRQNRDLCRGCRQSEDYKRGIRTYTFAEYNRQQLGKTLTERFGNNEWKKNHHVFPRGVNNPHVFNIDSLEENGRGYVGRYKGILFRSFIELSFIYLMLKDNHNICSAEKITILYTKDDELHQYRPDFLVDDKFIVEIKDVRAIHDANVIIKKKSAEEYCDKNNLKYVLISNKDFKQLTRTQILELFKNKELTFSEKSLIRFKKYWLKETSN